MKAAQVAQAMKLITQYNEIEKTHTELIKASANVEAVAAVVSFAGVEKQFKLNDKHGKLLLAGMIQQYDRQLTEIKGQLADLGVEPDQVDNPEVQ